MHGIEHLLLEAWNGWVARGGRADAEPLDDAEGWVLRLCGRARVGAWIIFFLFTGLLAATICLQIAAPLPPRQFWFLAVVFSGSALFSTYYLLFSHLYRPVSRMRI